MRAQTPAMTSARTAPAGDRILMEAQNLARLNAMETPLMGGENPQLHPSDFSGVTPRAPVNATPNPLLLAATPMLNGGGSTPSMALTSTGRRPSAAIAGVSSTPSSSSAFDATPGRGSDAGGPGSTPMRTPMRDALGLNDLDSLVVAGGRRAQQQRQAALRSDLRAGLSTLPAPQNEYQIEMPELPDDDAGEGGDREEDAADAKVRRQREEEAERLEEERRKSRALQRQLPRPVSVELVAPLARSGAEREKLSMRERADEMLALELVAMLEHDAAKYPIPTGKDKVDKKAAKAGRLAVPALQVREAPVLLPCPAEHLAPQVLIPKSCLVLSPCAAPFDVWRCSPPPPAKRLALSMTRVVSFLPSPAQSFSDEELKAASSLLDGEVAFVIKAMDHSAVTQETYMETWASVHRDFIWVPSKGKYERAASATNTERVESVKVRSCERGGGCHTRWGRCGGTKSM